MSNKILLVVITLMVVAAGVLAYINSNKPDSRINENKQNVGMDGGARESGDINYNIDDIQDETSSDDKPAGCVVTGCSNHICASGERITTCEYKEEYACYADAVCEMQSDGECGWTLTDKSRVCLEEIAIFGNSSI